MEMLLWTLFGPKGLFVLLLALGVVLLFTPRKRGGRRLLAAVLGITLLLPTLFLSDLLALPLENRFPVPEAPAGGVDGIIALGGSTWPRLSNERDQVVLNDAGERLTTFVALARRFPEARLVFSGGVGGDSNTSLTEAEVAKRLFGDLGLDPERVLFEDRSSTTWQNALFSQQLVRPVPGERWLLITSARHMPRAVGSFRRVGWEVIPYPVDYGTTRRYEPAPAFDVIDELARLDAAVREWAALIVYRLQRRTDAWLPGPTSGSPAHRVP